jgi:predicted phage terminase large subunit-like protein
MLVSNRHEYHQLMADMQSLDDPIPVLRELCQTDLFFLLRYGLNRTDVDNDWLFERCREVQASPDGMLDLWAREHYKSTIITFALTIQDILNDPNITIGIFSHTRPSAKAFLRQIKREFELNENLKKWFPEIFYQNPAKEAIKWSEDDGIIVKRSSNPKESTVEAWGVVDGQPTGKHFRLLIYDDIVTKESVSTPEMMEKTTDGLALSFNLGAHGGKRRFIGTRYHFNDTYRVIIERGTAKPRIYAATHDGSLTGEPVFLTQEQLDGKRRDFGLYIFSCQMLQNPVADASQNFKREWLRYLHGAPPGDCNWYILVDAANSKRKGSDYTSMWAVGLGHDGKYYIIPEIRDRLNLTERAHRLIKIHRKYKPQQVRYERYGMMGDIAYIMTVQEQMNYRFDIIEVAGPTSKIDRIKRLIPLFEKGLMYMPEQYLVTDYEGKVQDNSKIFEEQEFVPFPVPIHDDMLDALARITETEGGHYDKDGKFKIELIWPMPESYREEDLYPEEAFYDS